MKSAPIRGLRRPNRLLEDELANAHTGIEHDGEGPEIGDFKLDLALESRMDRGRCDMHREAEARQGAFAFDARRNP